MNSKNLAALLASLPDDATLPVGWLREQLSSMEDPEADRDLTLEEVAERVHRSVSTVRTWCNSGALQGAYKLRGRDWRIPSSALQEFFRREAAGEASKAGRSSSNAADLGAWRKHLKGKGNAA